MHLQLLLKYLATL